MPQHVLIEKNLALERPRQPDSVEPHRGLRVVRSLGRRQVLPTLAGVCTTLLLFEVCLRPWSGLPISRDNFPISDDSITSAPRTLRYFREGLATIHSTSGDARLTGNSVLPGAPWVVILGDSYVEGFQVNDRETMGSQLESLARSHGLPLNVRQYGRSGNAPAHYVLASAEVRKKWDPRMVVVAVNSDDFLPAALDTPDARMEIKNGQASVFSKEPPSMQSTVKSVIHASAFLETVARRTILDIFPTLPFRKRTVAPVKAPGRSEQVRGSLDALAASYGSRLFLLYIALPGLDNRGDDIEPLILARCAETGMRCASTRARYIEARDREHVLAAGFINTIPGSGHYNAAGHRIIAESLWHEVKDRCAEGTW